MASGYAFLCIAKLVTVHRTALFCGAVNCNLSNERHTIFQLTFPPFHIIVNNRIRKKKFFISKGVVVMLAKNSEMVKTK